MKNYYHNEIMNLPEDSFKKALVGISAKPSMAYAEGHRDARHGAAELAIQADNKIEALESALKGLMHAVLSGHVMSVEVMLKEAKEILEDIEGE